MRSKLQQTVISVCCLCLMVFVFAWMINLAVHKKNSITVQNESSVVNADAKTTDSKSGGDKNDSVKSDDTKSEQDSKSDKKDDSVESKTDESSKSDAQTDDFSDTAFIGDSRTVGLQMNTNIPKASFYASIGLNVDTATSNNEAITLENGSKGNVLDGLKEKKFKRIYIMFGTNEIGWPYPDVFEQKYEDLLNDIKKIQPDAKIYAQSLIPVSYLAAQTNAVYTNDNINKFNELIKTAAEKAEVTYLDVGAVFKDENGALPSEASTDGIHLVHDYCQQWLDYLSANQ